jgi:class 3 adenylate cyclase
VTRSNAATYDLQRAGPEVRLASRTCTILFTDLVGSTELRARLGDDAFDVRRRAHDRMLEDAVVRSGGEVVKHAGDGVMAVFAAAADALTCGVVIQQAVDRERISADVPFVVRVGVSAGDVVEEDGDYHGTPVVEAARLCAAAQGGQILAGGIVRALAGSRGGHVFTPAGALELKGLAEPVEAFEVGWSRADAGGTVPLRLAEVAARGACVGRDAEIAALVDAWKLASTGTRRTALVAGEPGIGKTRLASELAARVVAHGGPALHGWCDEDLGVPYQPWVQALAPVVRACAPEELRELAREHAADLARLLPEVGARLEGTLPAPAADADTERARAFDAVDAFVAALATRRPVLFVLDDLHWADRGSLVLLRHLLHSDRPGALLVVGTYRDTDVDRRHPLAGVLADLRREPRVTRLALDGLDRDGLAAMLADRAGHDAPPGFVHVLHDDTDGNPFFVEEVIAHFVETGVIYQRDGVWTTDLAPEDLGIPEGVRDVVGRRLSRLSAEANEILAVAAVMGREFDAPALVAACSEDRDAVLDALDEALATNLVREVPGAGARFAFSHALVRQTLAEEVRGARRARLHWRIGEALAATREPPRSLVAFHLCEGVLAGDATRATQACVDAAEQALEAAAPDDADALARRALEVLDDAGLAEPRLRAHALVLRGEAAGAAVTDVYDARAVLTEAGELALSHGLPDLLARSAYAFTLLFTPGEHLPALDRIAAAALDVLDPQDPRRVAVLAAWSGFRFTAGDYDEGRRLTEEAVALAERSGDARARAIAHTARATVLQGSTDFDAFARAVATAEAADDEAGGTQSMLLVSAFRAVLLASRGDRGGFEELRRDVGRLAAQRRALRLELLALVWDGGLAVNDGRLDDAEAAVDELFTRVPRGSVFETWASALRIAIAELRDREDEWFELLDTSFATDEPGLRATLHAVRALYLARRGAHDDAHAELVGALGADGLVLPHDYNRPAVLAYGGEATRVLRDARIAAGLVAALDPYAGRFLIGPGGFRAFDHSDSVRGGLLSVLGDHDAAVAACRAAIVPGDGFAPLIGARNRVGLAELLFVRGAPGDLDEARRAARSALAFAEQHGLVRDAQDAREALQRM